ncbi:hypothetical protein CCP1ISM_720001 [Azospirillaceae bacterium]
MAAIEIEGNQARFDFSGDSQSQAQLLRALVQAGLPVNTLHEEQRSMQAVYSEKMRGLKR